MIQKLTEEKIELLPSEYIEEVRYLPKGLTPKPGYYEYSYTPYLREIIDNLGPSSPIRKIAVMKSAQIGFTVGVIESAILYHIGAMPMPQLFVTADKTLAEKTMRARIEPMIENSGLTDLIFAQGNNTRNRTGSTKLSKEYPGGYLHNIGAKNPDSFRGMTYPRMYLDEIDTYFHDMKSEGNAVQVVDNRTNAFAPTRKILYGSTPLVLQTSQINVLYETGDQRKFFVPCPFCGEMQVLYWHKKDGESEYGIVFKIDENNMPIEETIGYKCAYCGDIFRDHHKSEFLEKGEWRATAKTKDPELISYWINALYSPPGMLSWKNMVYEFLQCWDKRINKIIDIDKYRSFRNTKQGLPFEEQGEALIIDKVLIHRRPIYSRNQIKNRIFSEETGSIVYKLTCAVDVQKTPGKGELLVDIKAWCKNAISYTLDFRHLSAEKDVTDFHDKCWRDLEKLIETEIWTADDKKQYQIGLTVIDAAWGESTDTVYQFCRQYSDNVFPIFGADKLRDGLTLIPVSKSTLEKAGCMCYRINTIKMKDRVSRMINASWYSGEIQPMFYMNFPDDLREDYFKQFTAEHKIPKYHSKTNKFLGFEWIQTQGRDNHAFDLAGYHFAAIELMAENICTRGLGLDALSWPAFWGHLEKINK